MTDRTEERLEQGLRSRADVLTEAPLTLAHVKATARTIRRRRRSVGAGVAAALVAAVLLPLGLGGGDDTAVVPAPQPAVAPTGWLTDGTVHLLDGTEVPLGGVSEVRAWAPLGEGYVAAGTRQGAEVVSLHDADGSLETTWPATGPASFVVDDDGRHAAWVLDTGEPVLLDAASGEIERLSSAGLGRRPRPVGIAGTCPDECGVVLADGSGSTYLVPADGAAEPFLPKIPQVVALSPDDSLVAGLVGPAPDDIHSCGGVWSAGSGQAAWEDCNDNQYLFSPDSRYVATTFAEGLGPNSLRLKDAATGVLVHEMRRVDWMPEHVWVDDEHVLVNVQRGTEWSLVRIGVDRTEEVLAGPAPGVDEEKWGMPVSPYLLPTGP
ncbi:hypothetical protein [Nocardioides deserti]|uniref:WD40 repeat domain-containing protein n=1 Tax=Nocardioides deserti TaxID=1588644 RepID=A0ABR6UBC6_9ACTN|nr:hypothetical protein [Nocardioides deserti]MBC2961121.1 hypothetical protein [Nocardioides deserti]GGO76426.1 hypothetical protein GCM10012276_29150 [Nocardioides deserti]